MTAAGPVRPTAPSAAHVRFPRGGPDAALCAAGKLLMALSLKLPPVARPKEKLKFDGLGTGIAAALCDVRTRAQADAMRLIFGLLSALMALCLAGTRHLVNTAAPRRRV